MKRGQEQHFPMEKSIDKRAISESTFQYPGTSFLLLCASVLPFLKTRHCTVILKWTAAEKWHWVEHFSLSLEIPGFLVGFMHGWNLVRHDKLHWKTNCKHDLYVKRNPVIIVSLGICFIASGNHSFHFMDLIPILINFNLFFSKHCLSHVNYIVFSGNF